MKRRQRKTVLNINGESDSPRRRWPNERQYQNGSPNNPLANFLGQYNSDSEAEDDTKPRSNVLNDQVNDFLKEIQSIAPKDINKGNQNSSMTHSTSYWQECYDEQTGYPYYWHTETNQVTWEMPAELKIFHEKCQETTIPHSSHIPQWPNISSSKFSQSQSNIPEGMIPKEVVARNRNRQAGILNKPEKPPTKINNTRSLGFKKDDSSDDGKIEMITSFGNDESDSDESEHEELRTDSSYSNKPSLKSNQNLKSPIDIQIKVPESNESKSLQGSSLSTVQYGPYNKEKPIEKVIQLQNVVPEYTGKTVDTNAVAEDDILTRIKSQAKLLQFIGSKPSSPKDDDDTNDKEEEEEKRKQGDLEVGSNPTNEIKLSLVPGYEDDSEGEEETTNMNRKPLFPIAQTDGSELKKSIDTCTTSTKIFEYCDEDVISSEEKVEESTVKSDEIAEERLEESKNELEYKANKFLESIDAPSKAFQRKKRIAFDVVPNKNKTLEDQEIPVVKDESTSGVEITDRRGLCSTQEEVTDDSPTDEASTVPKAEPSKKSAMVFVKASSEEVSPVNSKENDEVTLKILIDPVIEKLKFLSEGSPAASAVQVMAVQIQTLVSAWESGDLQESYLRKWLIGTGCELTRLEQTAAPPGWECQWDRSHKRYYYRNSSSGEAQWTYPETDIVGGTEEMELCTTPPPPEQEETPIIEMSTQAATIGTEAPVKDKAADAEQQQQSQGDTIQPSSAISSPSPPTTPSIFEDEHKHGRKRKCSSDDGLIDTNEDDLKEDKPMVEPLPPGVDPPEIAYTLPASAIEAGVLYGAQQTNPIYAATLAGAGIPILSHHHTALMQSQLMHYNPAYHQHLHNQALVAARLSGQEAVQFMVAEYARVYENSQVIAKPPIKMPHESSLGSALNSFYSDIASIEQKTTADIEKEKVEFRLAESTPSPIAQVPPQETDFAVVEAIKEKKKKKLKTGIGKKQKEMSSMVAKWQRAQKNYKDGH